MTATLDPDSIRITRHAVDRYQRRRRGNGDRTWAEQRLRELVDRCKHQSPPVRVMPDGRAGRRYKVSKDMHLVVSADCSTLITFLNNK